MDDTSDAQLQEILRDTPLVETTDIQQRARKLHGMWGAFHIVQGDDRLFRDAANEDEKQALRRVWKQLVFDHPGAYLLAHWDIEAELLGLGPDPSVPGPVWNVFLESQEQMTWIDHNAGWSLAQYELGRALNWLHEHTSLFAPYIYALLALALLVVCSRDRITIGLFTSGLFYELSFFPFDVNPDYRYSHWMIASTCIAIAIMFVQRLHARST